MISFRLHEDLYKFIKKNSEIEYTSISRYITNLIIEDKKKKEKNEKN
jgi:hypothetical protein